MELGQNRVQGLDYAYTLQGWIKGVNSNILNPDNDMGGDGASGTLVAKDAFSYSLHYYEGDYTPIATYLQADRWLTLTDGSTFGGATPNLYNGNISRMVTSSINDNNENVTVLGKAFRYDQLNRITHMEVHKGVVNNNFVGIQNNEWKSTNTKLSNYETDYTYDANGNILTLERRGLQNQQLAMDDFTYNYYSGTNRLEYVDDQAADYSGYDDIKQGMSSGNYTYDEIGNLIADDSEEIDTIEWTVYGKISRISRTASSTRPELWFRYAPDGNRIMKQVVDSLGDTATTYYVRDAQGNVYPVK